MSSETVNNYGEMPNSEQPLSLWKLIIAGSFAGRCMILRLSSVRLWNFVCGQCEAEMVTHERLNACALSLLAAFRHRFLGSATLRPFVESSTLWLATVYWILTSETVVPEVDF